MKKSLFAILIPVLFSGCESIHYYSQAIKGHLTILNNRTPIKELVVDPNTPTELSEKLTLVLEARQFAEQQLLLPVDDHYLHYVDLHRDFVVWNVVAAPEFSVTPHKWCYPIVGCVSYRGYYNQSDAEKKAERLQAKGYDVSTGGVVAYSTLGWFKDPVLNTFANRSDYQLASLLFHELAHQLLYFKNDTTFNESFATTVELAGLQLWLKQHNEMDLYQQRVSAISRQNQFIALLMKARTSLEALYDRPLSDEVKRQEKLQIFTSLKEEYFTLKDSWESPPYFDHWFDKPLNNARLAAVATYHDLVPQLQAALVHFNGDFQRFYEYCLSLEKYSVQERKEQLDQLIQTSSKSMKTPPSPHS